MVFLIYQQRTGSQINKPHVKMISQIVYLKKLALRLLKILAIQWINLSLLTLTKNIHLDKLCVLSMFKLSLFMVQISQDHVFEYWFSTSFLGRSKFVDDLNFDFFLFKLYTYIFEFQLFVFEHWTLTVE